MPLEGLGFRSHAYIQGPLRLEEGIGFLGILEYYSMCGVLIIVTKCVGQIELIKERFILAPSSEASACGHLTLLPQASGCSIHHRRNECQRRVPVKEEGQFQGPHVPSEGPSPTSVIKFPSTEACILKCLPILISATGLGSTTEPFFRRHHQTTALESHPRKMLQHL